jgi:hypothetical protein
MAGEGGRRALRPRASTSAAAAPSDNVRQTRAATKRSAMDECRSGSTVLHPRKRAVQPSGRRAPLTDISKLVNAAPSGCAELGGAGELKCQELKAKPIVEGDENAVPEASEKECARAEAEADSEAALDGEAAQEQDSRSSSSAVASLERRTSHTLFISKESKDRVKQGELFSDRCQEESSSWSDGLAFRDIDTDHSDPQMCSTYAADIYMHLRMAEVRRRVAIGWGSGWGRASCTGVAWHAGRRADGRVGSVGWVGDELTGVVGTLADQAEADDGLHGDDAEGHQPEHEGHSDRLAGGGGGGIQAGPGHAVPDGGVHRSVSVVQHGFAAAAAAAGRIEHADRGEVRGDLRAAGGGVLLHHGQHLPAGRGTVAGV